MTDENNTLGAYKVAYMQLLQAQARGADMDSVSPLLIAVAQAKGKLSREQVTQVVPKIEKEVRELLARDNPRLYGNFRG